MADFYPADVGRTISAFGGVGTITAYVSPSSVTVEITQPFPATGFDSRAWTILGSPLATCTPGAKDPVGATTALTLSAAGWRDEDVGKYVKINGGLLRITAKTSDTIVQAVIEKELNAAVAAPAFAWTLEASAWGGTYGWPRCGAIFEQRLWLANSPGFPNQVWGSVIGDFLDHTIGTQDDEAMSFPVGGFDPILHLVTARGLLALTTGGEFSIQGGQDRPITPTNIRIRDQSNYGTAQPAPVRVGAEIFMLQRAARKVRALSPNQYDDGQYVAPDMSVLAEHITASGIADMGYRAEPDALVDLIRNDGQMATLTADRDQEVFAWSRQITQGGFESIEVVPNEFGSRAFVIVSRAVDGALTRYVETFEPDLMTDSAITGSSPAGATIWGGLSHLRGRTVQAKGDGVYLGTFEVSTGGQITLPRVAYTVEIGLAYETTVKTLTPEFPGPTGSSQGHQLSVHEVKVRLLETLGCRVNLQEVSFRKLGLGILDQPPQPFTGDKVAGNLGWGDGVAQTLVQQTLPYKFHLLSIITRMTANEG